MGVIYKLKPDIINFVLEEKRKNASLSCRGMITILQEKFQIKVSKSSVNSIFKNSGLSMPVGRRAKRKRQKRVEAPKAIEFKPESLLPKEIPQVKPEPVIKEAGISLTESSGVILLKAADYLLGGSNAILEVIKSHLTQQNEEALLRLKHLITMYLFELGEKRASGQEALNSYLNELQIVKTIVPDMQQAIFNSLQEARGIKLDFLGGGSVYLDGQLHTVWASSHTPFDFSSTLYNTSGYIKNVFAKDAPLVLFTAPGYDSPSKEFFDLMLGFEGLKKRVVRVILFGNRFEELEVITLGPSESRRGFVFCLWPWQFVDFRKVDKLAEYKPCYLESLNRELHVAEAEISLFQPIDNKRVTLKGYALKTSLNQKVRLIILSNITGTLTKEEMLNLYFTRWPNLEEGFEDFSRKIELFTYTQDSRRFFSAENLALNKDSMPEVKELLSRYISALDGFVRWHFLPLGYENMDFPTTKERFYSLKTAIKEEKRFLLATFNIPLGYPFLEDLAYIVRRVNERAAFVEENKRLRLAI